MKPVTACFTNVFINNFKNQPYGGFQFRLKLSAHLKVPKIYLEFSLQSSLFLPVKILVAGRIQFILEQITFALAAKSGSRKLSK